MEKQKGKITKSFGRFYISMKAFFSIQRSRVIYNKFLGGLLERVKKEE